MAKLINADVPKNKITLEMSNLETLALRELLSSIGGCPNQSIRGIFDGILAEVDKVFPPKVEWNEFLIDYGDCGSYSAEVLNPQHKLEQYLMETLQRMIK